MKVHIAAGAFLILAGCDANAPSDSFFTPVTLTQQSHPLAGVIWDVGAGKTIDQPTLEAELAGADIVILGEVHDNPRHHERQALLVASLDPAGLAFEMVPEGSEEGIEAFRAQGGKVDEIGPAIGWSRLGWPDWDYYSPIFEAAPEAYIAGGATSTTELMLAIREGAAVAFGAGADRYDLDALLDARVQSALEDEMVEAHCNKLPRSAARGMAEAQRLRDARFADATLRASAAGGGKAVLITGNGHARTDRGVPAYLNRSVPDMSVASLGQIEVVPDAELIPDYLDSTGLPYDYVWFSARADRPDPCESFN